MAQTIATDRKAYIITGPTSGIGRCTAFELAKQGTVVLVGRDRGKLAEVQKIVEQKGQHAVSVVCDLSDLASVRRAASEIIALHLPIAGLLNNVRRLKAGDLIVFYSPRELMGSGPVLQAFTAAGRILHELPYEAEQSSGFRPYRRRTKFFKSRQAPVRPLLQELTFTQGRIGA
ncbi:MAG: SDR family NAD(P)-dependent oxidoreductase [Candidatus Sulfotelmatobacter sp.]